MFFFVASCAFSPPCLGSSVLGAHPVWTLDSYLHERKCQFARGYRFGTGLGVLSRFARGLLHKIFAVRPAAVRRNRGDKKSSAQNTWEKLQNIIEKIRNSVKKIRSSSISSPYFFSYLRMGGVYIRYKLVKQNPQGYWRLQATKGPNTGKQLWIDLPEEMLC